MAGLGVVVALAVYGAITRSPGPALSVIRPPVAAYRRAVEVSREALRANPRDAPTMARLAVYLAKLGKFAEAKDLASEAVAIAPTSGDVLYRQAVVLALSGGREQSVPRG